MACVLVTGAGGFIGGHVVRHLTDAGLWTVVAATRDGRGESRRVDLRDAAGMEAALAGVDAIVHCAVGDRAVTVDGTRALLQAAAHAGVRRFVYLSSVAVYGPATGAVAEDTPLAASGDGYAGWKIAAEQACHAQPGIEAVVLRPAIVYGPGGTLWVENIARRILSGQWGVFGPAGDGTCNLVHVGDLAGAIAAALTAPGVGGQAFNVAGPEAITWNEWFTRLAAAIGAPPLRSVSPAVLRARAYASLPLKALARVLPGLAANWLLGAPARSELALFALRATYPTAAASRVLAWQPSVPLATGLAECATWLRERRLVA